MYMYSTLIYGFDFSDYNCPDIGINLNSDINQYLEECDFFESYYSGCSNSVYIGKELGSIDPTNKDCDPVKIVHDAEQKVKDNKDCYDSDIKMMIDSIIEELEGDDIRTTMNNFNDFTEQDINEAIEYFVRLKTIEPSIKTLIATS